ncbi:ribosomal protein S5 domain 2-type protein [Melanogaster broomeanus]|nr:ribosomal protein S5 domain 2-type protein [Melanogaster broomeanus]
MSLRPIKISFDALSGVDGSARFSFGATCTALASVSGPIAARLAAEHPARATVEVHVRPLSLVPGTTEKYLGAAFKGIVERACVLNQHPRTLIQVVLQALSRPTNALIAAEINACSLALVNAGSVPMRGVACAVSVGRRRSGSQTELVLDPEDESELLGGGCFAFLFGVDELPAESDIPPSKMIWTNYCAGVGASFSSAQLAQAEELASKGAAEVWIKMKESLQQSLLTGDSKMEM